MKTIRFIAYLFYRYYSSGATKDIPYFSTLCALVMLIGLHIFQILVLFDKASLLPTSNENTRAVNFLIIALCLLPIFFLASRLIKKSDLHEMHYEESRIKKGNRLLILYIVASIVLLLFFILLSKEQGCLI
ncbi:hypothetical protein Q4E93_06460 [Flavitalea sp. BT771]|uniref:hypothetical protein n=1 Tax=Flavitalea sp. BT771 TaxID=3063329 RepID=UPI0026E307D9|nr:hypothetical protein [Flavitalea sp. BT771]MDO6430217.1 hypothetical protein [Flavitalea sp. BT771]MDV6219643.1 hypothetical protein [Flavitalea sp. BT771]